MLKGGRINGGITVVVVGCEFVEDGFILVSCDARGLVDRDRGSGGKLGSGL